LFWKFQAIWQDWFLADQIERFEILTLRPGRERLEQHAWFRWADIIHLHWTAGFLAPKQAWSKKVWVLSLHDCHPFTGVCHFPGSCRQFESGCRACPQLAKARDPKLASRRFQQKERGYKKAASLWLHAPSHWIGRAASKSLLLGTHPVAVIPNIIPTRSFRCLDREASRQLLDLPQGKKLALFVAGHIQNTRKGFGWFQDLAAEFRDESWVFVVVGGGEVPPLASNCMLLGPLGDARLMASAYSAADVFISTAVQDNLPSTIIESLLCGTPVIGFASGGPSEMVHQGEAGWLETEVSVNSLIRGLEWFDAKKPSRAMISEWARSRWSEEVLLPRWMEFYRSLV
jgi:glycosyltransferase involved in cell wall biosynthesis